MKRFRRVNPIDRIMAAITFAEANEQETARGIMNEPKRKEMQRRTRKTPENRAEDKRPRLQM